MSVTLGFDFEEGKPFVQGQFDKYNEDAELTQLEAKALVYIRNAFDEEKLPFENILLRRHSASYLSLMLSENNDFCRIKAGPKSTWVSLDVWGAKFIQDDCRFSNVKNRKQRHWKITLNTIEDFANVTDLIIAIYKNSASY